MTDQSSPQPATPPAPPTPAPAAEPAPPAPPKRTYTFRGEGTSRFQKFAWKVGQIASGMVSMPLFRFHVGGQARIPKKGGVLLVTNHQSFLDPWIMGIAPERQMHYMARDTLFKGGFLHWLMELWNTFPVKRGAADLSAIRNAVERLDQGFVLNIFPEGTRTEDGSIGPIAPGVSLILNRCKTDVTLMPVLIDGAFEAWPRNSKFPRPCPIRIQFGNPIFSAEWRTLSPEALARRIRTELVGLQKKLHSPHASRSEARLAEDSKPREKHSRRQSPAQ